MKKITCIISFMLLCAMGTNGAFAQSDQPYLNKLEPNWINGNAQFWYRIKNNKEAYQFIYVDAETGTRRPAFDHDKVAKLIGNKATGDKLPIDELEYSTDGKTIQLISYGGSRWKYDPEKGKIKELPKNDKLIRGLKPQKYIKNTEATEVATVVSFMNELDYAVSIYWVDYYGRHVLYKNVKAGGKWDGDSFEGEYWLVKKAKPDTTTIAGFISTNKSTVAIINDKVPKPIYKDPPQEIKKPEGPKTVPSPDKKFEAFVKNSNLWVREMATGKENVLSSDGSKEFSYHRDAIRSRAMGMNYDKLDYPETLPEVYWSPDSKRLIAIRTKVVPEPRVHLVESSPANQTQPKHESYPYIKAGDEIPTQEVHLFHVDELKEVQLNQALWANAWVLNFDGWEKDSQHFNFVYNKRGHQQLDVISLHGITGKANVVVSEKSNTFINYSGKFIAQPLKDYKELLWMSERDGWNHLYVFDRFDKTKKRQLTQGDWLVRKVEEVDEEAGVVWFWAGGVYPDQDPYYLHLGRAKLDGSGWEILTKGDGTHSVQWSPSPEATYFIDTWSRVDQPPVHELRETATGKVICELEKPPAMERSKEGPRFPERFVAKGRDGKTDIYGIIHYPENFDPKEKYPIIEYIYAGPHGAFVPKPFKPNRKAPGGLGEHGYVVVQIDGMGTNWRSKAFHDVAWKNIKDAGYPDRILWIKAASETRPWMDTSRVGVFGGSAGGQNAMRAVLDYAHFYKAAAADCGCHDNRMDKIWWNEAWMGCVDSTYILSSNVEDAHKLGGALLLTVGELDKNVDPSSTYQVVDALIEADKEFEYMLFPGGGHGSGSSPYGKKLRIDFFNRHLKE